MICPVCRGHLLEEPIVSRAYEVSTYDDFYEHMMRDPYNCPCCRDRIEAALFVKCEACGRYVDANDSKCGWCGFERGEPTIFVLMGPSGGGKTTIAKASGMDQIVSVTTRAPRPGEQEGIDYYFLTDEEFTKHLDNDELAENTVYGGNRYGIRKSDIQKALDSGRDHYVILDHVGANYIRHTFPNVVVVLVYANVGECWHRMRERGESFETIKKRVSSYEREMTLDALVADQIFDTTELSIGEMIDDFQYIRSHCKIERTTEMAETLSRPEGNNDGE